MLKRSSQTDFVTAGLHLRQDSLNTCIQLCTRSLQRVHGKCLVRKNCTDFKHKFCPKINLLFNSIFSMEFFWGAFIAWWEHIIVTQLLTVSLHKIPFMINWIWKKLVKPNQLAFGGRRQSPEPLRGSGTRQPVSAQEAGPCCLYWGLGSLLRPGPLLAAGGIWGAGKQMRALSACLSNK